MKLLRLFGSLIRWRRAMRKPRRLRPLAVHIANSTRGRELHG